MRPERGAAMEMDALLAEIERLLAEGDRHRYDTDSRFRWLIHRLWIAIGNEASVLEALPGDSGPWRGRRLLRNEIAHVRLPDIDEDTVWRMTTLRPGSLRARLRNLSL